LSWQISIIAIVLARPGQLADQVGNGHRHHLHLHADLGEAGRDLLIGGQVLLAGVQHLGLGLEAVGEARFRQQRPRLRRAGKPGGIAVPIQRIVRIAPVFPVGVRPACPPCRVLG
jgi:hypothetical protein